MHINYLTTDNIRFHIAWVSLRSDSEYSSIVSLQPAHTVSRFPPVCRFTYRGDLAQSDRWPVFYRLLCEKIHTRSCGGNRCFQDHQPQHVLDVVRFVHRRHDRSCSSWSLPSSGRLAVRHSLPGGLTRCPHAWRRPATQSKISCLFQRRIGIEINPLTEERPGGRLDHGPIHFNKEGHMVRHLMPSEYIWQGCRKIDLAATRFCSMR